VKCQIFRQLATDRRIQAQSEVALEFGSKDRNQPRQTGGKERGKKPWKKEKFKQKSLEK
jgi:hypothetical protein